MVAAKKSRSKIQQVLLRIDGDLLARIDAFAKLQPWPKDKRSDAIRTLIAKGLEVQ